LNHTVIEELGSDAFAHGTGIDGSTIVARLPGGRGSRSGVSLQLAFDPADAHLFDAEGQALPRLAPRVRTE
jgi:hypothetical protein